VEDLSNLSMMELFRVEAENQTAILTSGLLELERNSGAVANLEKLMRAAHSLKGAARIVDSTNIVRLAHAMEDCFVAAQRQSIELGKSQIDVLLQGVDFLLKASKHRNPSWERDHALELEEYLQALDKIKAGNWGPENKTSEAITASLGGTAESLSVTIAPLSGVGTATPASGRNQENTERVVRLAAENLNRLLALAGESLVESRWLRPFSESLQRLKRQQSELSQKIDALRRTAEPGQNRERSGAQLMELAETLSECQQFLTTRIEDLEVYDRRSAHLAHRLYLEVLRTRMRPFGDGVRRFPRMVRDLARSLKKEIRLEVFGEGTPVDRDILERLETPLAHLLRNSVDHGCESPDERRLSGKPAEGVIKLEARHSAGMLVVSVSDDGCGVSVEKIRHIAVEKRLLTDEMAQKLSEAELLEFLFLPGFTMKETVTEISGRGVGLDVVQNMVKSVRGNIRLNPQPGRGLRVQLQLPLTLSVLRALLVDIGGEPYAIPLGQIVRTLKLSREQVEALEGRYHFQLGDQQVGLLTAHQVLNCAEKMQPGEQLSVVVLGERATRYGLVVDRFLGERELVVQALDPRLGKVKDISAAALMEDGSPALILDVDDVVRSIEKLITEGSLEKVGSETLGFCRRKPKRVLAVDDSLTVRELERKLLTSRGYDAEVAIDGVDGWNAVRTGNYDLVVTDVDMPRMDGIELATLIKQDPNLKSLPVMIVSYKDHEEDRLRGLEAGADYYLTKGSFHDETLMQAVIDLIGEPDE
jgi:two-component system sensor histidine kinase and response regulator WspE